MNMVVTRQLFIIINLFVLLSCGKAGEKRILLSDPDYSQSELKILKSQLLQYQTKLTAYEAKLTTYESKLATQELKLGQQEQMNTAQETKLLEQQKMIKAQEDILLKQQQNITQQEQMAEEQQSKMAYQQSLTTNITKNLTDVLYHNFFDEMAQATCTAITDQPAFIYAIRRDCSGGKSHAPTCNDICATAGPLMLLPNTKHECFDALQVEKVHNQLMPNPGWRQPDAGKPSFYVFRYLTGGCTFPADHCGPNYCCCRNPY